MPGPGQGKRGNKKKWRENTLSANIMAVNAVFNTITADPLANETAPSIGTAAADSNDETRVDTATAASSINADSQLYPPTYMYDEVQELLDEARLEGWREGMDEGYRMGKQKGVEDGREEYKKSLLEGHDLGMQSGKEEERGKWLAEGHGPGLCVSMQQRTQEIKKNDKNGEPKENDWEHGYGHCVSIEEGHLRLVTEVAKAMASKETEPATRNDATTQTTPEPLVVATTSLPHQ